MAIVDRAYARYLAALRKREHEQPPAYAPATSRTLLDDRGTLAQRTVREAQAHHGLPPRSAGALGVDPRAFGVQAAETIGRFADGLIPGSDGLTYTDRDFGDLDPCETCGTRTEAHEIGCLDWYPEADDELERRALDGDR